jgi:hypothetical protein
MMLALKIYVLFVSIILLTFLFVYIVNKFFKDTILEKFVKKHIIDSADERNIDI